MLLMPVSAAVYYGIGRLAGFAAFGDVDVDDPEVDAEARAVAFHRVVHRAAVEQDAAALAIGLDRDHQRQAMIGAAERGAGGALHAHALQPHPFARHEGRRGGQRVRDVVHEDGYLDPIDRPRGLHA